MFRHRADRTVYAKRTVIEQLARVNRISLVRHQIVNPNAQQTHNVRVINRARTSVALTRVPELVATMLSVVL